MRSLVKVFAADVPALTAAALVGLNRNTTQRYYDRLRLRIGELARKEAGPMAGEVEVDESYFGARRVRGKRAQYFFLHLKESEWRWNHRHDNLYLFLLKNLRSEPL